MVEVGKVEFVVLLGSVDLLHILFYLVYLLYHALYVHHNCLLVRLVAFLLFSAQRNYLFKFISSSPFLSLWLALIVVTHIVLLHLLEQLLILSLGDLLIPDTHMPVLRSYPSHGDIDHICKTQTGLIDLELILLQEVEIKQVPLLLIIDGLNIILLNIPLHLLDILVGKSDDISRRLPDVPKVVNLHIIVGDHHRVINEVDWVFRLMLLYVVVELAEFFIEVADAFDIFQRF